MAKSARKGPSASQAIRDYCRDNPDKSPKEVAAELVSRGFATVTAAYVSTIKSLAKKAASEGDASKPAETSTKAASKTGAKTGAKRGRKPRAAADSTAGVSASSPTRGAGAKGRKAAEASTSEITIDAVLQAKKLAALLGGVAKAQAALDALAKLGG